MRHLTYWFNMIIKKRREFRRWQRVVMVLAAMMIIPHSGSTSAAFQSILIALESI